MATIKSYTDLDQSKVLSDILPPESADFHFSANLSPEGYLEKPIWGNPQSVNYSALPCWSLAALLDNIPQVKLDSIKPCKYNKLQWRCCSFFVINSHGNSVLDWHNSDWCDNPVDACYDIILKLN